MDTKQAVALQTIRIARMKGMGVLITSMRRADVSPTKQRVMRSPRQDATGGAMLSWRIDPCEMEGRNGYKRFTWVIAKAETKEDEGTHEGTEDYA